ncbi:uncharacterized protein FOMMEDRAFT_171474 [Fomitiporia mediterranea MF3/22]|uniref:uncharacterized protein n=1 Tax=Fomitiporia mediterranea (strain MF3/22) TaxID=694068 RepID=UPI00044083F4|nr:uncharacterized protein FOMMEDRAFT_171474 [Fomitiporia mediterranea MF3/22]EJC98125.1 hypothetical protein FOMMEDRAFT_171474 [Fomitiporia mediterranea MF3/22]
MSTWLISRSSRSFSLKLDLSKILGPPEGPRDAEPRPPASPYVESEAQDEVPDSVVDLEPNIPSLSFIVAIEAWKEGKVCYISESVSEILGKSCFEREEVIGTPAYGFCHPDDAPQLYRAYQEMISEDKAACIMYLRVRHHDPRIRFVLGSISCSRVGQHLIGALSIASSTTKAMHNASTAQEVIVISPEAAHLHFRRWNEPPPITAPTSPVQHGSSSSASASPQSRENSLDPPSPPRYEPEKLSQSLHGLTLSPPAQETAPKRVAFVLDRFSVNVPITYANNDDILPRSLVLNRSFYDFVTPGDESRLRKALDAVKGWGVNERGHPSDGGFAFNRFHLYLRGRDSSVPPDSTLLRNRRTSHADTSGVRNNRDRRTSSSHNQSGPTPSSNEPPTPSSSRNRIKQRMPPERGVGAPSRDIQLVDVIFSPQSDGIIAILRPALPTR